MGDIVLQLIHALTIEERRDILGKLDSEDDNIAVWRSVKSRVTEKSFEYRLFHLGYTHKEFNNCIQNLYELEQEDVIQQLKEKVLSSDWYQLFLEVIEFWKGKEKPSFRVRPDISMAMYYFTGLILDKIDSDIASLKNICIDSNVVESLEKHFYMEFVNISSKTLVYEFNERKKAATGKYTIADFIEENCNSLESVIEMLSEYPVLIRRIVVKMNFMYQYVSQLLKNIDNHFDGIKKVLQIEDSNKITEITIGLGDTHENGKSVATIKLGNKKLVYKPHEGGLQKQYNTFLKWVNQKSSLLPFYISNDYYAENFTVNEFIEYQDCKSEIEVHRYYERMGQHLALLYLLSGTDIHCENIIAMNEYPVIIDHETFCNNTHMVLDRETTVFDDMSVNISDSVINTGILPVFVKGIDFGALAGSRENSSIKYWVLVNQDDENIEFVNTDLKVKDNQNLPILNGEKKTYMHYKNEILRGFLAVYEFIKSNKDEVKEQLALFSGKRARIVLQATQNYADLLQYTSHPKYVCDMLSMERLLENLWIEDKGNAKHFQHEVMDAINCDVPLFYTISNTRNLYSSRGECIENYFKESSIEIINQRMEQLDDSFAMQVVILKKQLGILKSESENRCLSSVQRVLFSENRELDLKQECLDLISRMNDKITERLIINNETLSWYQIAERKEAFAAELDYIDGSIGLAQYVAECKKCGIALNPKLEEAYDTVMKMILRKEKFYNFAELSPYRGMVSSLVMLLDAYKHDKNVSIVEEIVNVEMYLEEMIKKFSKNFTTLNIASIIQILSDIFDETDDFRIQNNMEVLGNELVKRIMLSGVNGIGKEEMATLGDILYAFYVLEKNSTVHEFATYKDMVVAYIKDPSHWVDDAFVISDSIKYDCSGTLQRFGEKLIKIGGGIFDDEIQRITKLVLAKKDYKNDTLLDGYASSINYMESYLKCKEDEEAVNWLKNMLTNVILEEKMNGELSVESCGLCSSIGLSQGYIGVLYTVLRFINNQIDSPII